MARSKWINLARSTRVVRSAINAAAEEARKMGSPKIDTGHILLGMLVIGEGLAPRALHLLGLNQDQVRLAVAELSPKAADSERDWPANEFSADAVQAFEHALDEAERFGHHYASTEGLLLGLTRLEEGPTAVLFEKLGVTPRAVRGMVEMLRKQREDQLTGDGVRPTEVEERTARLVNDIEALKAGLQELRRTSPNLPANEQVERISQLAQNIEEQGKELTARVRLPPMEDMEVPLVPAHVLDRLEEYRSDEAWALLLLGLFAGAGLGVMVNWATAENLVITRVSLFVIVLFAAITVLCGFWLYRLRQRSNAVKVRLLSRRNIHSPPLLSDEDT